jgi:hypothetical protein
MQSTPDFDQRSPEAPDRLLDARFIELDPLVHGFVGALVELRRVASGNYEVRQRAAVTGNRLFMFTTSDEGRVRALFDSVVREGSQTLPSIRDD